MIEEIKNRVSILDLLNRFGIDINRSGFIKSIYKEDKTPSMKIYPVTNSYYCYATNQGGDIIKFYMDYCGTDIKTAVNDLKDIAGIDTNKKNHTPIVKKKRPAKYCLLKNEKEIFEERTAIIEYENNLTQETAEKKSFDYIQTLRVKIQIKIFESLYSYWIEKGLDESVYKYLTGKERGLTDKSIKKFRLFSINDVKETFDFLKSNFTREEIIISGLFKNKYFLFSKHRLIIPYIEADKITYLRGRFFYKGKITPDNTGKYIGLNNWTNTLSSKRFYNIDTLNRIVPFDELLITEGEFDCIIAEQNGFNSIGIPGVSNFPKEKVSLIKNQNLYFVFDSDEAGQKAINKIKEILDQPFKSILLTQHKDWSEFYNDRT